MSIASLNFRNISEFRGPATGVQYETVAGGLAWNNPEYGKNHLQPGALITGIRANPVSDVNPFGPYPSASLAYTAGNNVDADDAHPYAANADGLDASRFPNILKFSNFNVAEGSGYPWNTVEGNAEITRMFIKISYQDDTVGFDNSATPNVYPGTNGNGEDGNMSSHPTGNTMLVTPVKSSGQRLISKRQDLMASKTEPFSVNTRTNVWVTIECVKNQNVMTDTFGTGTGPDSEQRRPRTQNIYPRDTSKGLFAYYENPNNIVPITMAELIDPGFSIEIALARVNGVGATFSGQIRIHAVSIRVEMMLRETAYQTLSVGEKIGSTGLSTTLLSTSVTNSTPIPLNRPTTAAVPDSTHTTDNNSAYASVYARSSPIVSVPGNPQSNPSQNDLKELYGNNFNYTPMQSYDSNAVGGFLPAVPGLMFIGDMIIDVRASIVGFVGTDIPRIKWVWYLLDGRPGPLQTSPANAGATATQPDNGIVAPVWKCGLRIVEDGVRENRFPGSGSSESAWMEWDRGYNTMTKEYQNFPISGTPAVNPNYIAGLDPAQNVSYNFITKHRSVLNSGAPTIRGPWHLGRTTQPVMNPDYVTGGGIYDFDPAGHLKDGRMWLGVSVTVDPGTMKWLVTSPRPSATINIDSISARVAYRGSGGPPPAANQSALIYRFTP